MAKKRGAVIVKDIWEEKDEDGVVRFGRVQTVCIHANKNEHGIKILNFQ